MNFLQNIFYFLLPFFLLNVLMWPIFMLGIKIRTVLKLKLNWLHGNVPNFNSRCPGSREIAKTQVAKVLWDTLYCTALHCCQYNNWAFPDIRPYQDNQDIMLVVLMPTNFKLFNYWFLDKFEFSNTSCFLQFSNFSLMALDSFNP